MSRSAPPTTTTISPHRDSLCISAKISQMFEMRRVTKGAEGRGGEEEIQVGSARNSPLPGWANQDSSAVNRHMLHIQISVNCTAQTNITPEGEVGRRMWKTCRTHPYIYITLSWFAGLLLLIRFFAPSRCIYLCLHPVVMFSDSVIMRGNCHWTDWQLYSHQTERKYFDIGFLYIWQVVFSQRTILTG